MNRLRRSASSSLTYTRLPTDKHSYWWSPVGSRASWPGGLTRRTAYRSPERAGLLRYYFVRVADAIIWADRLKTCYNTCGGQRISRRPSSCRGQSVTIIPATVFDNYALLHVNPEYLASRRFWPLVERERPAGWQFKARPSIRMPAMRQERIILAPCSGSLPGTRSAASHLLIGAHRR
jgi:hypothetical protein